MNSISSHIKLTKSLTYGRVLVVEVAGEFEGRWWPVFQEVINSIRRHRPDRLVIDVRKLSRIRACLSVFLELPVAAAGELRRLSAERQTRLVATGEDATALKRIIPMAKLQDVLGRIVFPDLESALGLYKRNR